MARVAQAKPPTLGVQMIVTPLDFSHLADGHDWSRAVNAAIATGLNVDLLGLSLNATALTQTKDCQEIFSSKGLARIFNSGATDLFTSSGHDVRICSVVLYGNGSAGHNVVSTGDAFTMRDCGSRGAVGRAVKATGTKFRLIEAADIYQSAGDYDVEVGTWDKVTYDHDLCGFTSNQATGGILLIKTGSTHVTRWRGGKITVDGDGAEGTNGGTFSHCRPLGNVTVNVSNAQFGLCKFGPVNIVLGAGTTGIQLMGDTNEFQEGCTITDNGANLVGKQWRSEGFHYYRFGDDSSTAVLRVDPINGRFRFPSLVAANNTGVRLENADGSEGGFLALGTTGDLTLHNWNEDHTVTLGTTGTGSSSRIQSAIDGTVKFYVDDTGAH